MTTKLLITNASQVAPTAHDVAVYSNNRQPEIVAPSDSTERYVFSGGSVFACEVGCDPAAELRALLQQVESGGL